MENAVLQLLDVLELKYTNNIQKIGGSRTFCALSLRKRAKTEIETGGKIIKLSDRSLTYFPSNTQYKRNSVYDDMVVIHFNSSVRLFDDIETITDFDYPFVLERFQKALSIWNSFDTDKYYKVSAILYEIIGILFKSINRPIYSEKLQAAMNYIKANLGKMSFSVNDVSKFLNICPTDLRNLFWQEIHCSPKQYIIDERMSEAMSMLNSGYWSVSQVAERVGYSDQKNFSTAFKKHFGYPPSKQRYNYYE